MKNLRHFLLSILCFTVFIQSLYGEDSSFNIGAWKANQGQAKDLKIWSKENPSPYRGYYSENVKKCAERWFVNLGPLGICTLMHDRSWYVFRGVREIYPKVLTDQHWAALNAFEVKVVKAGSPSEGILKEGDLLIKIDDHSLKGAQHMFVGQPMDNKEKRGLEIHAGQLIDKAEARGEIKITYLRLPDEIRSKVLGSTREWKSIKQQSIKGEVKVSAELNGPGMLRIRSKAKRGGVKCEQLEIINEKGVKVVLTPMQKRGDKVNKLFELPAGKWRLNASLYARKESQFTIEQLEDLDVPEHLAKYRHTVTLKLDRIGSFGDQFDPKCAKARNYAAMLAHRIAVQQNKDGSWSARSYASQSFYTSVCGLALLSTDNPIYDAKIKLAAEYVANAGERDKWTYSNGMWLIFLSEYYLKTKDASILPALKMHIANCRRFVTSDYTAGHSYARPGYGGSGYIGGGGVIACGLALASKTPVMEADDLAVLDKMLERIQEIAPGGKVPYGRTGKKKSSDYVAGQGGSCGTGPYFIASLVRGGAEVFTKNATKRYSTAPFGSAENGHATQTLHFVWACLSSANCGADAHRENMNAYLWKFTTLREFDGTVNRNNYRMEYHNGDGVIGEPYWRTAGYLLIMNAHLKNLLITGNLEYRSAPRHTAVVYHRDRARYNEVLRNWSLVEAYLKEQSVEIPAQFYVAIKKLRALEANADLGEILRAFLQAEAPAVAEAMLQLEKPPKHVTRGQLAELILGVYFQASCYADGPADPEEDLGAGASIEQEKAAKQKAKGDKKVKIKKRKKLIEQGKVDEMLYRLRIRPISRLQQNPDAQASVSTMATALFKMENLSVEVIDPNNEYLKTPIKSKIDTTTVPIKKRGKPNSSEGVLTSFVMKHGKKSSLLMRIQYQLAGLSVSYTAPFEIPAQEARGYIPILVRLPVKGSVVEDYCDSYSPIIQLKNGQVIGCEQRSQPAKYLLAGAQYDFEISPGSVWGHDLRTAKPLTPDHRLAKVISVEGIKKGKTLLDHDYSRGVSLAKGKTEITMTLEKPEEIQRVFLSISATKGRDAHKVAHAFEAFVDGKWELLRNGHISGMMPTIVRKTDKVRLTLYSSKGKSRLNEVHLITPAPISTKANLSW